ncbi:MAG: DUF1631 family protein [Bermanella sp.]
MSNSGKPAITGLTQGKSPTHQQVLCKQLSEILLAWLKPKFDDVFDKVDDSLFDQAERSGSNNYQQQFFETMRMLRVERETIEQSFLSNIRNGWRQVKSPDEINKKLDTNNLSLMHKDELEEQVANDTMIDRVQNNSGKSLDFLIQRCQVLMPNIQQQALPFHPHFICLSFSKALGELELEISCKLIILKLFDRQLLSLLNECFQQANQVCVENGVLTDLSSSSIVNPTSRASSATSNAKIPVLDQNNVNGATQRTPAPENFNALRNLLPQGPSNTMAGSFMGQNNYSELTPNITSGDLSALRDLINLPENNNWGTLHAKALHLSEPTQLLNGDGSTTPLSQINIAQAPELISILNQLQTTPLNQESGQIIPLEEIQKMIQEKLNSKSVKQVDGDALNLVAMLFEFILGDKQLSIHMKELLGRLQIPMLKVAVLDHEFFSDALHPARLLLNGLARAGQAWNPRENLDDDRYYQILAKIVYRVSSEFKEDMTLFSDLNEKLNKLLASQKRRQGANEHKVKIAEEAQVQLQLAQSQALEEITELCEDNQVPDFLLEFLSSQWSQVLGKAILTNKEDQHNQARQVIQQLIWSIQPKQMSLNRQEFLQVVPTLLKTIKTSGKEFKFKEDTMQDFFDKLQRIHLGEISLTDYQESPNDVDLSEFEDLGQAHESQTGPDLSEFEDLGLKRKVFSEPDGNESSSQEIIENNVIIFNGNLDTDATNIEAPSCAPIYYEQVSDLSLGARFDLTKNGETIRCNLAVVIKSIGKYIFVNRHGFKVDEKNTDEMAQALQDGNLKHLDDSQLFDRALEAVIGSLRQHQSA